MEENSKENEMKLKSTYSEQAQSNPLRKLYLFVMMALSTFILSGCMLHTYVETAPTNTPNITQKIEVTPTPSPTPTLSPTPIPTPTPEPTPTPMPELTFEQKKALLGIGKMRSSFPATGIMFFNISFKTEKSKIFDGRICCIAYTESGDPLQFDYFSVTDGDIYLFTLRYQDETPIPTVEECKYLAEYSPNLRDLKLNNSTLIIDMATYYREWGLDYKNNSTLNDLSNLMLRDPFATTDITLTKDELIKVIIESTPQDEIIPFWMYTPGAKIPEELKGIFNEVDYPLASLPVTVPQSNRVDRNATHGYANSGYYNQDAPSVVRL